jgi:TfoX N-terminal domain
MPLDHELVARMRLALSVAGALREVKMFGGLCFMLNGNMVAGASRHGMLVRVGKDRHAEALARPGANPMQMSGRPMAGYASSTRRRPTTRRCGSGSTSPSPSSAPCRRSPPRQSRGARGPVSWPAP